MWDKGNINGYEWHVKHYDEANEELGINGGKISKLFIYKGDKAVVSYDREWIKKPATNIAKDIFNMLVYRFN